MERLRNAVDAGDLKESEKASDAVQAELRRIYKIRFSPETLLTELESEVAQLPPWARQRFAARLAVMAWKAQNLDKAESYAREALSIETKDAGSHAENVFHGNQILGLIAMRRKDTGSARHYLLASMEHKGWSSFAILGPNVELAHLLLEAGHTETVLDFLELCKPVWPKGVDTLNGWKAIIRAGSKPDFGHHLWLRP